jgi:hypothetical protein
VLIYIGGKIFDFPFFTIFDCGCTSSMITSRVLRMTQKFYNKLLWYLKGFIEGWKTIA